MPYLPIEDHAVIGDLHTVALVGKDGVIDFLSHPHFDSPTVFASLLDAEKGGSFRVSPHLDAEVTKQHYLPDTNVLLTRFLSEHGLAHVIDFMPVVDLGHAHAIYRRVKTIRGEVTFRMSCAPRFDYARSQHKVTRGADDVVFQPEKLENSALRLRATVPLSVKGGDAEALFTLRAGETAEFILAEAEDDIPGGASLSPWSERMFETTVDYWRRWIARCTYRGRWKEIVDRSALTLKLLTSRLFGSIVAAPTFGLPEEIGGERNWDYRYTWIRDSAFTLYALQRLGYTEEARAFMEWLVERCAEPPTRIGPLQIMYGIDGRSDLTETTLSHFEGYRKSSPVRIGNGAATQLQLDIYGELMDSVYLYDKYGEPVSYQLWTDLVRLVDWVRLHWREKDEGIWETRGGKQEFLYSRLMCWVAFDRALRLADKRSLPAPRAEWLATRDAIHREIHTAFWNPARNAFVQTKGGAELDAACLIMPLVRFVGPTDPRWLSTLDAVRDELVDDTLVYRYRLGDAVSDGLRGEEGTFSMCSFWYVECLARAGRIHEARFAFEKMLGYANHVGLYAEELGPRGEHLGNFPQAFTHLALISAAFQLNRSLADGGWRA